MDLDDLRIFRAVVDAGGITRAAKQINRVPSNVTTRIRQLEDKLGAELFIREGKAMHLSPAGTTLLDYADRLLDLAREAQEAVGDGTPRGPLRLGSMESAAAIRLPEPLSEFHRRHPEVKLSLRTGNILELKSGLLSGALDAAVIAEPVDGSSFDKAEIYREELALVTSSGHAAIRSARDVRDKTILVFETGCPYRLRLQQWYARVDVLPAQTIEMSSWHAIIGCTIAGMGMSVMPRAVLATIPPKFVTTHALPAELNHAPTVLAWRRGAQSPKISALLEILKAHGAPKRQRRKP